MGFLWSHFQEGGWGMYAILIITMIPIFVITIERAIAIFRAYIDKDRLLALLKSQIMAGNIQGAIKVCAGNSVPLTRILQAGLAKFSRPDVEIQAGMDEAALRELPRIETRTGYLAMLGNVALLATTDGGKTWTVVKPTRTEHYLAAIACLGPEKGD